MPSTSPCNIALDFASLSPFRTTLKSWRTPNKAQLNVIHQQDGIEPCALEFLVHFVGDVHQPLHVSYASDWGGNKVKVSWFGTSCNLHQVWDEKIIQRWNDDYSSAVSDLEDIANQEPELVKHYISITDPVAWADESFQFVRSTVYNYTENEDGIPQLDDDYYNTNLPIVQQRLIAGGVRLGKLLNSLLVGRESYIDNMKKVIGHLRTMYASKRVAK